MLPLGTTTAERPAVHPPTDGTTYVTAGAGGRGLYRFGVPDSYAGHVHDVDEVRSHVAAILRKLRVADREAAVRLLDPDG